MATSTEFLFVVFFFLCIYRGNCCYPIKELEVIQAPTGKLVENKTQFLVTVKNKCICVQENVVLGCDGFKTVEKIDPSILNVPTSGAACLLIQGLPVVNVRPVSFTYAWDTQYPFKVTYAEIACS